MAVFRVDISTTQSNEVLATANFAENTIPDEFIREYRTFVETGFAAVLAKASTLILTDGDPKRWVIDAGLVGARIHDA